MRFKPMILPESSLFAALSTAQRAYLQLNTRMMTLSKGEYIEENNRQLFQLISGKLIVYELDNEGNEFVKYLVKEGAMFGNLLASDSVSPEEFAKVVSQEATIAIYPNPVISDFLDSNAGFAKAYAQEVWNRCKVVEKQFRVIRRHKEVRSRLIYLLLNWGLEEGSKAGDYTLVENHLTHEEIASLIGTTRVTTTNLLNQLRQQKAVIYDRNQFQLNLEILSREYGSSLGL